MHGGDDVQLDPPSSFGRNSHVQTGGRRKQSKENALEGKTYGYFGILYGKNLVILGLLCGDFANEKAASGEIEASDGGGTKAEKEGRTRN